jgi:hypothetical protein
MDKVQNPSNSVCYAPSSEPYRILGKRVSRSRFEPRTSRIRIWSFTAKPVSSVKAILYYSRWFKWKIYKNLYEVRTCHVNSAINVAGSVSPSTLFPINTSEHVCGEEEDSTNYSRDFTVREQPYWTVYFPHCSGIQTLCLDFCQVHLPSQVTQPR